MTATSGTQGLEAIADAAAPAPEQATLEDRYRGVMLGLAVGNALGLPVEGESEHAIRRHFPQGVTEIDPGERDRPWDDDLAQAMILAEVLAEAEAFDTRLFADRLVSWARENGRGIGMLTRSVIDELETGQDPHEAARRAWERNPMSSAGNGAVMRCPPVALRHLGSGVELVRAARTSALVTHYDARCEWSTVVTTVALSRALVGRPVGLEELTDALGAVGGEGWPADAIDDVVGAIRALQGSTLKALSLDDPMDMGYTLKAMQVALWCIDQRGDLEQTVVDVVGMGGDTDTNGALAGAVMGAVHGASNIPERWLSSIRDPKSIVGVADQLLEVGTGSH